MKEYIEFTQEEKSIMRGLVLDEINNFLSDLKGAILDGVDEENIYGIINDLKPYMGVYDKLKFKNETTS